MMDQAIESLFFCKDVTYPVVGATPLIHRLPVPHCYSFPICVRSASVVLWYASKGFTISLMESIR